MSKAGHRHKITFLCLPWSTCSFSKHFPISWQLLADLVTPIWQIRKWKYKEIIQLAQGHTDNQRQNWLQIPGPSLFPFRLGRLETKQVLVKLESPTRRETNPLPRCGKISNHTSFYLFLWLVKPFINRSIFFMRICMQLTLDSPCQWRGIIALKVKKQFEFGMQCCIGK